jgi:excisionase family DNA binding protein
MKKKTHYSVTEAAEFLGIHPETLRRWDRTKKLEAEKINKRGDRRYDYEKLKRFKESVKLGTDKKAEAKKEIEKSLKSLDDVAEKAKYLHQIGDYFRGPRDMAYYILEDEKKSNELQALMNLFGFEIVDDDFKPKMSGTDENGKFWCFPDINEFTESDINYLKSLQDIYENPRVTSRIAHFLWKKKGDYKSAQLAVDNYLSLAEWLNSEVKNDDKNFSAFEIVKALKNAYILAKKINYRVTDVNKSIANVVLNFDNKNDSRWAVTKQLISFSLENKSEYGADYWEKVIEICKKFAKELELKKNLFFARDYLSLGEKIEISVFGLKNKSWRKKIALSLEQEAEKHKESFVESDFLVKAITEYKKLGEAQKVQELEIQLTDAKKNMKFQTFSETLDLTDWVKQIRERFKAIVKKEDSHKLLVRLSVDSSIIPRYDEVKKQSEEMDKEFPLQSLFSHTIIDDAGNMPRKYDTELEKKHLSLLRQYYFSLMTYEAMVRVLFEEIIEEGKLTPKAVFKYISENLWYGKEYEMRDSDTGELLLKSRKWLDLLSPGMEAYLDSLQLIKDNRVKDARNKLLLSVDSLTPKVEGLIREFYENIGVPTTKIKTERNGKQVTEKKGLDELLRDPKAVEIFGDDLVLLMKYVLIELTGYNLRNNVSHALMFRENYLLIYAHWLFVILLRIGAYEFSIQSKNK